VTSTRTAERWVALEFVAVVVSRTLHGFAEQQDLLGPQQYAAMLAAFAMLAVLVMYGPTAELAAVLGLILVLATLLRPTTVAGKASTLGADVAGSVAAFTRNVGTNAPSIAQGFTGSAKAAQ
jgi:hypothetical protein